jgi:hypothetical protein
MLLTKTPVQLSVVTRTRHATVDKARLLERRTHVLCSSKILRPIDRASYMNLDIPQIPLIVRRARAPPPHEAHEAPVRDYIVGVDRLDDILAVQRRMEHPYLVSEVRLADIAFYAARARCDLLLLRPLRASDGVFAALSVAHQHLDLEDEYEDVPVARFGFRFARTT